MRGTVKSKEDVERLFRMGRRSSSSLMTVLVLESTTPETGRTCFIAGKKLGNAPLRSRCKRVMREVARELGAPWRGYDIAFIARRGVAHADHRKVLTQAEELLGKLGVR